MRRRFAGWLLFSAVIVVTALYYAEKVHATPSVGFTSTPLGQGRFGGIDVSNYFIQPNGVAWLSFDKTQGQSDVYVQNNAWDPGGSTGWHSHPGHSLIIVTAGTITDYEGNDPNCRPHVYKAGMGFVDPGGNHVHIIRNEGTVPAQSVAVQVIPAGQPRRVDAADPGNCHFPN